MSRLANSVLFSLILLIATIYADGTWAASPRGGRHGPGEYDVPFYPHAAYRPGVESPGEFLGYPLGSKPATHPDIIRYFEYLAASFDNVSLETYAKSYEGRRLVYLVVTSPKNAGNLDDIRRGLRRLASPAGLSAAEAKRIIRNSPAVAWMAYGIHGDELSSCDAALQLAYQLVAGTDDDTRRITDELVVVIDPLQNPDGRTRWLGQLEQWGGAEPNYDIQSLHHRGVWPYGRTNHYLFDLNRDWFSLIHPETRGKTRAMLEWMPQYVLDCHEMGPTETYLFSPPREPFNPYMTRYIQKWWRRVAETQAAAFDAYGWSYYTREWNEEFFPGYGSSWAIYLGAVGMLFEQAGVDGSAVKRPDGTVLSYREAVHHQFIGSVSNLIAVANGREELLRDYYDEKVSNIHSPAAGFVFPPATNRSRLERLVETLSSQHIDVERADSGFRVGTALSSSGETVHAREFPEGSVVVRTNQPLKQLVEAILTFDIRVPTAFLESERKEILKRHGTRLYDATAWSLPHAYDLEAYYTAQLPRVLTSPYVAPPREGGLHGEDSAIGFVFDGDDDRAVVLLAHLLGRGYNVWASTEPFQNDGRAFSRGSYQIRLRGNPQLDVDELRQLSEGAGVDVYGIKSSLAGAPYADLGGDKFKLLESPRIALVGGNPVSPYDFGAIWHLLDVRLGLRATTLDLSTIADVRLDSYNVLVLPSDWEGAKDLKQKFGETGIEMLKDWVRNGGTLIAEGSAAAFVADTSVAISSVRLKRQVLPKLALYEDAAATAIVAEAPVVDSVAVWSGDDGGAGESPPPGAKATAADSDRLEQIDGRERRFYPRGAILRAQLDAEHWLAFGCGESVPVMFDTDYAYVSKGEVEVPARLAPGDRLRLAGLVWNEARARWGNSAYAAREKVGNGQVILFATLPNFRGYFLGAERLLSNAMLLGPGMGTSRAIDW